LGCKTESFVDKLAYSNLFTNHPVFIKLEITAY